MSAIAETLVTAFGVSGLAAACLAVLRHAPPRVRLAVAAGGLAAWVVPWGALRIVLPPHGASAADAVDWLGAAHDTLKPLPAHWSPETSVALPWLLAVAALLGLALFVRDCLALRRCLRRWRASSRAGDELRRRLPPELAGIAADIRIVEESAMAAASGWLRPTIWLGDKLAGPERTLALVHEAWHVRARDPLWLVLIAAVRRAYWWNPLVAHLARQAVLMLESRCDHRCAAQLGKTAYVARLASMLLAAEVGAPRLVASVGAASLAVQRLRLLHASLRLRARDVAALAVLALTATGAAAAAILERGTAPPETAAAPLPATPAGDALAALLRAANARDSELMAELLGAWTPQEVQLPLPRAAAVRVVDVLRSEPLRIEYVVESPDGQRHVGTLAVSASAGHAISAARLGPLR